MNKQKMLVEKFAGCLGYSRIKNCKDAGELEVIVDILRSGKKGHYPATTKFAEAKLSELKPNSAHLISFKHEVKPSSGWDELDPLNSNQSSMEVKTQEQKLCLNIAKKALPPKSEGAKIAINAKNADQKNAGENSSTAKKRKRSAGTDYFKWEKYNADLELLHMDLKEDQQCKVDPKKNHSTNKKTEKSVIEDRNHLTKFEKALLAEQFRLLGNGYFRAKQYGNAKADYTRAIETDPDTAVIAYNNRAIANIKLKLYQEAIDDCMKCLDSEPTNIKALLRLAEAHVLLGKKNQALSVYDLILCMYPRNETAVKGLFDLNREILKESKLQGKNQVLFPKSLLNSVKTYPLKATLNDKMKDAAPRIRLLGRDEVEELIKTNRTTKSKFANALKNLTHFPKPKSKLPQQPAATSAEPTYTRPQVKATDLKPNKSRPAHSSVATLELKNNKISFEISYPPHVFESKPQLQKTDLKPNPTALPSKPKNNKDTGPHSAAAASQPKDIKATTVKPQLLPPDAKPNEFKATCSAAAMEGTDSKDAFKLRFSPRGTASTSEVQNPDSMPKESLNLSSSSQSDEPFMFRMPIHGTAPKKINPFIEELN